MRPRPAFAVLTALIAVVLVPGGAQAHPSKAPTHIDTPAEIGVDLATQVRMARLSGMRTMSISGSQQFLPTTWCGGESTTDDVADAAQLSEDPVYKVVYAYASDQPDRFATWQNQLQANVSLIGQFMSLQDGATKSPRFDMGTSCGPRYVDIQTVALPNPRSFYSDQTTQFGRLKAAVAAALDATPAKRNVVILADGLGTNPGGFYGLGEHYTTSGVADVAGASNIHNSGGLYAALFPPLGYDPPTSSGQQFYPGFWPEGMLHEMTHTLGAVNSSSPHATSAGHCTDGSDVMCYADGGTSAVPYSTTSCPAITGSAGMTQTYDCGRDDYFSTSPAPGSYLATHWNVYDSVFESACATIGFACGADATAPPAAVSAPHVTGTRKVTNTLTADQGTWSGTPTSFAYQWQRIAGANPPADIPGATEATYTLAPGDANTQVQVEVTASNTHGSASNTSAPSAIAAFNPPVNSMPPSIGGIAQRTRTLTAANGTWSNAPTAFAYQWQRDQGDGFTDIDGALGQTYLMTARDLGAAIRVLVSASNSDGASSPAASASVGPVLDLQEPANTTPPSVPAAGAPRPPADVFKQATVALKRGRRVVLKLGVTSRTTLQGIVATIPSKRVKVARRGTYRLTLCAGSICITKPFRARHGKAKLPAIVASSRIAGPVTLKLLGPGGRATGAL